MYKKKRKKSKVQGSQVSVNTARSKEKMAFIALQPDRMKKNREFSPLNGLSFLPDDLKLVPSEFTVILTNRFALIIITHTYQSMPLK